MIDSSPAAKPHSINVLVVDDSAVVRQLMKQIFSQVPGMNVAVAHDPLIAWGQMERYEPDVIVLDLEMPRMDGLTFLKKLMKEKPTPVVICSSLAQRGSRAAMQALELGAVEVVAKPKVHVHEFLRESAPRLVDAVRAASQARIRGRRSAPRIPAIPDSPPKSDPTVDAVLPKTQTPTQRMGERFVAIAASTGGTEAVAEILTRLPADTCGLVVLQQMPQQCIPTFVERLAVASRIRVKEAKEADRIERGLALVAPGNCHLAVTRLGNGHGIRLIYGPPVRRHCPSADVLFRSVAQTAGPNAVGVILTGIGDDGAQGLGEMRKAGAATLAQDEASCVVFGMPKAAVARGAVNQVVSLSDLPAAIEKAGVPRTSDAIAAGRSQSGTT